MINKEFYKLDLIKETGILHFGLLQKDNAKKELKHIEKTLDNKSNNAEKFIFLLNRFVSNYIANKQTFFSEDDCINISNPNHKIVEDFLLRKLKSFSEELPKLSTRFNQFSPNYFLTSPFFYLPEDWKVFLEKLIQQKLAEGYELTEIENDIKHSLSIFLSEFGLDNVFNISVFSFFDKWIQAPLTKDNTLSAELLNEEPIADWVKAVMPREIKIYPISKYLGIVDLTIKNITLESKEKFYLNKSPKKLFKFLCEILNPKNETQEIQIERFINNCFNWDSSKYGSLRNHSSTITFLNADNIKLFIGGLWYLNNKNTIKKSSSKQFETIIISELKSFNTDRIGLSKDGLRKALSNYVDIFKKKHPNLRVGFFK